MRIIRAQINWPRTEYSSLILLKDFFNNIHPQPTFEAVQTSDRPGWKGDLRQRAIPA